MSSRLHTLRGAVTAPLLVALLGGILAASGCARAQDEKGTGRTGTSSDRDLEGTPASPTAAPTSVAPGTATTSVSPDTTTTSVSPGTATTSVSPDAATETEGVSEQEETSSAPDRSPGDVEWMQVDEANKKVNFDIVAGLTAENSAWNFNGYANGEMTITVPPGWTVTMKFSSRDADVPHSLYIIDEKPPFTTMMPDAPGIPRAYSINLKNGIGPGKTDTLRFTTTKAGEFTMACGVPGHAASSMWDRFVVSADAVRPRVAFQE